MRMLEEITRIKTLMSLTEAINPMTEIFLGSYISKAWTAMKKDLGDIDLRISQNLDATLDNVTRTTLDDLAKQQGISSPESMDSLYLINSLVFYADSMTNAQIVTLAKSLSTLDIFSKNLTKTLISDDNFINTLKTSIIDYGVTPNEIKKLLTDYLGEKNATDVFNKIRVSIPTSSLVKGGDNLVDEFVLTPQAMGELVSTVESKSLKRVVNKVLSDKQSMNKILSMAEELSKTTKIGPDYFKTEFQKIVQSYPSFWDKAKQNDIVNLMKKAFDSLTKDKKTGNVSYKKTAAVIIIGLAISFTWTSSALKNAWRDDCLKEKGIDTPEEFNTLKSNKAEFTKVMSSCDLYVLKQSGKYKLQGVMALVSPLVDTIVGDNEDYVPSFVTSSTTTTTNTQPTNTQPTTPDDDEGALN
jgi:hypothetical protein